MAQRVGADASQAGKFSRTQKIGAHHVSMNPCTDSRVKEFLEGGEVGQFGPSMQMRVRMRSTSITATHWPAIFP